MKKFIMFVAVLFTAIGLTGCFGELESLEWETLPKSVYAVDDPAAATFMTDVSVKINGAKVSLQDAVDDYGATVSGFNVASAGERVITVKYKSLTIYWAYVVGEPTIPTFEPSYDWYGDGSADEFTLANENDLYGFANIVNGKDEKTADDFAGKTVKLGKNMDLTGKIWTPIGEGARKDIEEVSYADLPHADVRFAYRNESELTSALDAHVSDEKDFENYIFLCSEYFAIKVESVYKYYHSSSDRATGYSFSGTFDGQGYTITGLSDIGYTPFTTVIYANSAKVIKGYVFGFFGIVSGDVTVKNLTFEDVQINGAYYDTNDSNLILAELDSVGAAIGYAYNDGDLLIDNIKVLSGSISGEDAIGGIVGRAYNIGEMTFKNSENRANITSNGHAGGIVGYATFLKDELGAVMYNTIKFLNNTNYGTITNTRTSKAAKAAGAIINRFGSATQEYVEFNNCRNFGDIIGIYGNKDKAKGIWSGYDLNKHTITPDCVNYGDLTTQTE